MNRKETAVPTALGLAAVLIWSSLVAFSRSVAENLGTLNTAFFVFLFSGIFLLIIQWIKEGRISLKNLVVTDMGLLKSGGLFFILYMVLFFAAVGTVRTRTEALIVGFINYLWPGLTVLLALPIRGQKAKNLILAIGLGLAVLGTGAAFLQIAPLSAADILTVFKNNLLPYVLAFFAAVSWAVYSNLTAGHPEVKNYYYLSRYFFLSGLGILILILTGGGWPRLGLTTGLAWEFIYLVVFPSSLAYLFWDIAMKRGNKNLVVSASFLIPPASTLISGLHLRVRIGIPFWTAAVLIAAGAYLCHRSVQKFSPKT